jgi:ABC-type multidrug transport system fused ATPase/permease subunit
MDDVNGRYCDANAWSMRIAGVYGPGVRFLGHLAMAAVLLYGGHRVIRHDMTVGALAAFTLYLRKVFDPMQEMSQFYNTFQAAAAALEKLAGVLEEEPKVAEPAQPRSVPRPRGEVRLEHVSFAYREDVVLHDVDIVIPAGQTVALVGATGAGKSTVARLIARFYDPTVGRVTLDGVDLRLVSEDDMRRAVGMVTQEGFLFTGTIADNIAFGRPEAKRNELVAAAEAIGAHRFIARLPEGYDTDVAKRGGRLSAGQRQLISFARAFLADPRVLILDEATSSLDVPSERLVQRALRTLLADRTAVIIAHRLTTVEIADRLLVIDAGGVVEDGSAAELMGRDSHYRALHQAWQKSLA